MRGQLRTLKVIVDDTPIGQLSVWRPLTFEVAPGEHTVHVTLGRYSGNTLSVTVPSGTDVRVAVYSAPVPLPLGTPPNELFDLQLES